MPILAFLGRRLAIFAVSLLGASLLVFAVCSALPGQVAEVILGEGATPAQIDALTAELGLNRPWTVRYSEWVGGMLHGDFGQSYFTGQSVMDLMAPRIAVTWWLVLFALALSIVIAVPVGMVAAMKRRSWVGFTASALAQLGMAIPAFWAAIVLVLIFAVGLHWLPANGYVPISRSFGQWLSHLILPALTLGLVQSAVLVRYVRSAFIDVISQDYYRTARAIGWRRWPAIVRHGLRNASLQIVTVLGLQLSTLFVGAIVVESVFVLPGLGSYLVQMVGNRDLPVVQSIVMILVALVLVINLLVDLSYTLIDPRLRAGEDEVDD